MRLKQIVLIACATAGGGLALILVVGLLVPSSVLERLSTTKPVADTQTTITTTADGKKLVVTTKTNADGTTTTVSTDPATGNQVTTTADSKTTTNKTASTNPATATGGTTGGTPTGGGTSTGTGSTGGTGGTGTTGGTGGTAPATTIGSFTAAPSSIAYQAASTLSWTSANATACSITPGIGSVPTSGSHSTGALSASTTFTLSCSGNGTVSKQASVGVAAPPPACGQAGGTCSAAQVAVHNSQTDCWMIYGGKWYVVTSYVGSHPGGRSSFNASTCGVDITGYMNGTKSTTGGSHNHSQGAYGTLTSFTGGAVQ